MAISMNSISSTRRAMSISPTKSHAVCRLVKARLLVVDASQGVEAQTLANTYLALNHDLEIIPVINKIDLPSAEPERIREQIEQVIGLDAIVTPCWPAPRTASASKKFWRPSSSGCPRPRAIRTAPLRALIFDSWFDPYRGVIILARIVDGTIRMGQKIRLWSNGSVLEVEGLGYQSPETDCLQ